MLRERNFRRFYIGYVTSLLGTSMSAVAVTFAVLDGGGTPADLGYVMTARILPQVVFVLGGGVLADRLGRRPVMLGSDALRCSAQAALAGALLSGRPPVLVFAALGRRPRRPLVVAVLATFGYPVPCLLLALHAAGYEVAAGAFAAGLGGALFATFWTTTEQQQVPAGRLSRTESFVTFGAFGPGTLGLAIAGPVAALVGPGRVLGAGAAWAAAGSLVVLALPATRAITWRDRSLSSR